MAYLTESTVRARAATVTELIRKSAGRVLSEARASANEQFDIFLSHSSAEPEEIILGVKSILEDRGLSVYVDKYSDPQMSSNNVSQKTAHILRSRMRNSETLLYVHSSYSKKSRWMPWELGFFDGLKGKVGVIPVTKSQEEDFKGEEYLNLYPYVDVAKKLGSDIDYLWITESSNRYARLDLWAGGSASIRER